jgi:AraC family ethanolamine operon transcriptional activator
MNQRLTTTDFEEFSAAQQGWETCYRPVTSGKFDVDMLSMRCDGVQIDVERYGASTEISGLAPVDYVSFVMPLPESTIYHSKGQKVGFGDLDVYGCGQEVFAITRPGTRWICLSIRSDKVLSLGSSPDSIALSNSNGSHHVSRSSPHELKRLIRLCLQLIGTNGSSPEGFDLNKFALDEMLLAANRVLTNNELSQNAHTARQFCVARSARDFMHDRKENPPTILEIGSELGIPERTLHNAFSSVYGVSPKKYLMTQRLIEARQVLSREDAPQLVSDVAHAFGFDELGRFSMRYRTMFGETPSETKRRVSMSPQRETAHKS